MKNQFALIVLFATTLTAFNAHAITSTHASALVQDENGQLEMNPFDPNVQNTLDAMDQQYEQETGENPIVNPQLFPQGTNSPFMTAPGRTCRRDECPVYIHVSRSTQRLALYVEGELVNGPELWKVSTGKRGFRTPNFDKHPDGRIYQVYSSHKYPGYNNMPFAIFIHGGFALHGAPGAEEAHLGTPASHGCIRIKTSNVKELNRIVREKGVINTWVTVEE